MDLPSLSVTDARAALRRGDFSCVVYVEALLACSDEWNFLNAFVAQDRARLRDAARGTDARGDARGRLPLAGIPIALKDNIDTASLPTTGGTGALKGRCPPMDAPATQRLRAAGALLAGKTNMHELAFGITSNNAVTGAVHNPYAPSCIPGGSSGGSAAAVSARMVPAALGTDTGGSVRLPAALCGVVGFRPSVGRYPGAGVIPISHTRDTVGPLARCIDDIRLLDSVLSGRVATAPPISLAGLRLGIPRSYFLAGMDAALAPVVEAALQALQRAGVELVEVEVRGVGALNAAAGFPVALYELMQDFPAYLARAGYDLDMQDLLAGAGSPDVRAVLASQRGPDAVSAGAYQNALQARARLQEAYAECFRAGRVDALVFPTAILPARPIGEDDTVELGGARVPTFAGFIHNTDPGSNAGLPGISLPIGLTEAGLPVGLEVDGAQGSDDRLLAIAAALEGVLPPTPAPPKPAGMRRTIHQGGENDRSS